jgi:hypothetical protein
VIEGFYPVCAPPLTRRRFFTFTLGAGLAGALTAEGAAPRETDPGVRRFIERYAMRPEDPWALVHAIRGVGPGYRLNGERLAAYVLRTCVRVQEVQQRRYLYIPASVEVYTNMFLKTFLEAGVPAAEPFASDGRVYRLQALQAATQGLKPYVAAGLPLPKKMPIHSFTCGGTHLCYSLVVAAKHGFLQAAGRELLRDQLQLLTYRLRADPNLIDRYYREIAAAPDVELFRAGAKLKVLGHALECLGYAQTHGLWQPGAPEKTQIEQAVQEVRQLLSYLVTRDLAAIRPRQAQLVQQIVGDTCHACRGLNLV